MDAVNAMPEDRMSEYLAGLDGSSTGLPYTHIAALDGYAPSYDEWAVTRLMAGETPGTFAEYLREIAPDLDRGVAANDAMPDDSEWPAHPYEW